MKIWIDTVTGTWGDVDGLVIIDNDDEYMLNDIDNMSASEISEYGQRYGTVVE
jgi:hypothetical protein